MIDSRSGKSNGRDSRSKRAVRTHLEYLLASPDFEASERRRRLLQYLVGETLAGRGNKLKGYAIAIDVFERDKTFDPQSDPVVRLEARRLRRDLDSYYMGAGRNDLVRIQIPKGSYTAHFHFETHGPVEPLTAAVDPVIVVQPFVSLGASQHSQIIASGISHELIGNLMRFPGFRLYSMSAIEEDVQNMSVVQPGGETGIAYVINGSVQDFTDHLHVLVMVRNAATGEVVWSESYDRALEPDAIIKAQLELSGNIATKVGAPYGIVNADLKRQLRNPIVANMQSYVCVLRAYEYRRKFLRQEYKLALACLEETVERNPRYVQAWAMLGWMHLDAGRYEFDGKETTQEKYQKAFEAASRAIELEPDNLLALKAMASIDFYMCRYQKSERLWRHAVELNPYDPDTLAHFGWSLAARGNFEEGIPLLWKAIERTVAPPHWYFHLVGVDHYLKGEYQQMRQIADHFLKHGSGFGSALMLMACHSVGDREGAWEALLRLNKYRMDSFKSFMRDPRAFFLRHGATCEIADALSTGFEEAHKFANQASPADQSAPRS